MDEASKSNLIDQFVSIAGIEKQRASFFLESSNWDFSSFFDTSDIGELPVEDPEIPDNEAIMSTEPNPPAPKDTSKQARTGPSSNIATLSSIRDKPEQEPGQQAFYAGGSEHSGQQVLGPQGKRDSEQIVKDMFKQAKENAKQVNPGEKAKKISTFSGSGYTLGSAQSGSIRIGGVSSVSGTSDNEDEQEEETALKLWRNGFSVNDGPLREYEDPSNQQFLASIRRGEVPVELSKGRRRDVSLRMEDHRQEDYVATKKKLSAFACEGHRLGNPSSEVVSNAASSIASSSASSSNLEKSLEEAKAYLATNQSEPNTRIQIRLTDGSRLVANINLNRPVSDLRQYISLARPEYAMTPFTLMTTFPNKIIEDESVTIQESGLANSSVVQRLTK